MKLSYIKGLRELNMSKWRLNQVDSRFKQQDQRIDRIGAMSAAMQNMGASSSGMTQRNRFGIGVGTQGSEHAIAVGYQRVVSENTAITFSLNVLNFLINFEISKS